MAEQVNDALQELFDAEPTDPTRGDAEYWFDVYTRLLDLTESMLERTREYLAELPEPARRHVERVNIRVMEEEIDGFVRRRDVWRRHLDEPIDSSSTG